MSHITHNTNHESGFIALMSAIIIAIVLMTVTLSVSMTGFFGRFNILDSESKERSVALAEACIDVAVSEIDSGTTYSHCVPVEDSCPEGTNKSNCTIISSVSSGNETTIIAHKEFNKAHTYIKAVINTDDYSVTSWVECANLSPCP